MIARLSCLHCLRSLFNPLLLAKFIAHEARQMTSTDSGIDMNWLSQPIEVVACELFQQGLAETRVRFLAGLDTRCVLGPWSVRSADKSKHFKYRCFDNLFRVASLWNIRPICSNCNRGSLCIQLVPMGWSSHGRLKILFTSCLCWACTTRPAQWKHTQ